MPKSAPQISTQLDMSSFYNAVSKMSKFKPPQPLYTNTLPSSEIDLTTANLDLEVGSEMVQAKKPKAATTKTPAQRIEAAVEKATNDAVAQLNRTIIRQVLVQRIRDALNARFHNLVGPADLDRISRDAARSASYALADLAEIPAEFMPTQKVDEDDINYTAEPSDDGMD